MTLTEIKTAVFSALSRGALDRRSDMRWFTLATIGLNGIAAARTVVLRQFDSAAPSITFYTDLRSPKVAEIKANNAVALLFFDRRHMVQIRAEGHASLQTVQAEDINDPVYSLWQSLPDYGRQDYLTENPPGSLQAMDEPIQKLGDTPEFFCVVRVQLTSFDWLSLSRDGHQRARFKRVGQAFEGEFIVP